MHLAACISEVSLLSVFVFSPSFVEVHYVGILNPLHIVPCLIECDSSNRAFLPKKMVAIRFLFDFYYQIIPSQYGFPLLKEFFFMLKDFVFCEDDFRGWWRCIFPQSV